MGTRQTFPSWTQDKRNQDEAVAVGQELNRFLGPEYVSYRPGEGSRKFAYLEGHEMINLMNTLFGWDGWNSKVVSFETDYANESNGGKWSVGIAATVRLTVLAKAGRNSNDVWHEDVGYGTMENGPSRGKAMEKCRKEAVTDAVKRAGRHFGNATGGCLYNKEYLERVKKVKGPAERIEFVEEDLLRKPMNKRMRMAMKQDSAGRLNHDNHSGRTLKDDDDENQYGEDDDESLVQFMVDSDELVVV